MNLSRRSVVTGGACTLAALVAGRALATQGKLAPTLPQTMGPFYPVARRLDQDADLTLVRGRQGRARGEIINVFGRVLDFDGRPIPNAKLDLWQANAAGRYAHPGDNNSAPLDSEFQGAALFSADAEGRFRFRTVKPGRYPGRVPHLHFAVSGGRQRVVTQMYFPDEAGNQDDDVLKRIPAGPLRDRLIARSSSPIRDDASITAFQWDVVLAPG